MAFLFESFEGWKQYCDQHNMSLSEVVLEYEQTQKGSDEAEIRSGLMAAWQVMKNAVNTGLDRGHDFPVRNDQ